MTAILIAENGEKLWGHVFIISSTQISTFVSFVGLNRFPQNLCVLMQALEDCTTAWLWSAISELSVGVELLKTNGTSFRITFLLEMPLRGLFVKLAPFRIFAPEKYSSSTLCQLFYSWIQRETLIESKTEHLLIFKLLCFYSFT